MEGVDLARIERWVRDLVPAARPPFRLERLAGGRSNLTYLLSDVAGGEWVLRPPPLGPRQATAHDVLREGRIMAALAPTAVPVPAVLGSGADVCADGVPLLLMERVAGVAVRGAAAGGELDHGAQARAGEALAEILATLHAVEASAVGLADLGRGEATSSASWPVWYRQWEKGRIRELEDIEVAHGVLATRVPAQAGTAIVHGDFRLDNCLLDPSGEVAAVLDWEICTLGDPLVDLGLLLVYWAEPGDEVTALQDPPTLAPGFATRARLRRRYEAAAGIEAGALDFYLAFAWWKLACIVEGVYARVGSGALGVVDRPAASFGVQAVRLAAVARRASESLT
jgi:aminoglycoside phosphotransferase (APT) family kinase protein